MWAASRLPWCAVVSICTQTKEVSHCSDVWMSVSHMVKPFSCHVLLADTVSLFFHVQFIALARYHFTFWWFLPMWVQTVKIFPLTPADGCWLFLGSDACNEICLKGVNYGVLMLANPVMLRWFYFLIKVKTSTGNILCLSLWNRTSYILIMRNDTRSNFTAQQSLQSYFESSVGGNN